MWAKLNSDEDVIEEIIVKAKGMTVNEVQHPKALFSLWTDAERKAIGIVPITTSGSHLDTAYYIEKDPTYAIAEDKASVVMTIGVKDADKALDDLKSVAKNKITTEASRALKGFAWLIERKVTANTTIPSSVIEFMQKIRNDHKDICDAIDGASDMTDFIALHNNTYKTVDGKQVIDVKARIYNWTVDQSVEQYIR
tara:strand:+ start:108 stop:695 length:588 start_codon:yes stop_codon:yes gene_type:complete